MAALFAVSGLIFILKSGEKRCFFSNKIETEKKWKVALKIKNVNEVFKHTSLTMSRDALAATTETASLGR